MFFFGGWQGTTIANRGANLVQFAPTVDERNGNFTTCGAACNRPLTDPLTGQPFPNNQIPVSRFDPASVNVLKYMPSDVTGDGRVQVPRLIGQDDNQAVVKIDSQLGRSNQVGVRYFFDHFTNDPTYTEGNLLTYRNPDAAVARARAEHRRFVDPHLDQHVAQRDFASASTGCTRGDFRRPTTCPACRSSACGCRSIPTSRRSRRSTPAATSTSATTSRRRSSATASS